jgi:hypothetical protein
MKESEDILKEQIKSVFDNYEDPFAAQGWEELRKKYPEKKNKKLPILWFSAAAACLILAASTYLLKNSDIKLVNEGNTTAFSDRNVPDNVQKPRASTHLGSLNATDITDATKETIVTNKVENRAQVIEKAIVVKDRFSERNTIQVATNGITANPLNIENIETVKQKGLDTVYNSSQKVIAKIDTVANKQQTNPRQKLSTEDFLKEESKLLANTSAKEKSEKKNTTTIDIFTGTFFNYHDNREAKISAGLGLNANLKLSNSVILSVGAGISQNKISYQNDVPTQLASAMVAKRTEQNSPNSMLSYSSTAINDLSFNGRLLSIDLPVALKFYPTKLRSFYISTGINSSSYISEEYTYNYNESNFTINSGEARTVQETEKANLSGFDFANSAIIAVGINQNIGKHTFIFEPYYKPALNTMGNKNLKISSAGLNLKFNINGNKK